MNMDDERTAGRARMIIQSQLYREDPRAFFLSKMLPLADQLYEQFGIDAVAGGRGEPARFFDAQGMLCTRSMTADAAVLAVSFAQLDEQWTLAESGYLPAWVLPDAAEDDFTEDGALG